MRNERKHNRTVLGLYITGLYITTVRFPSHNNTAARCVHAADAGHVILVARPRLVERPEWTAVLDVTLKLFRVRVAVSAFGSLPNAENATRTRNNLRR